MDFEFKKESGLNLHLPGTIGSFKVSGNEMSAESLEVMFFLTHVSLDFTSNNSSELLHHLAPVREIYEPETLEFDEIMQRDLDDSRVSSELIPYLLDPTSRDLVKIFPPIVVVVLPTEPGSERPADKYPIVTRTKGIKSSIGNHLTGRVRAGEVSHEVFEFEYPIEEDESPRFHDFARLNLNTSRTKLVIVDGQHRAMALLALYRNLKNEWTQNARRLPYKDYYAEWSESYIKKFKLDKLSMPVMFCTFPDLDKNYNGDYDLKKAARAIFLALNKNAKKVSDSRNKLLDDNDIVSSFLRATLSAIKSETNSPLRIWNVELDQAVDKAKISSATAFTGVNHIYYIIEHLMFCDNDSKVISMSARRGNYSQRINLEAYGALQRLNGRDILGADVSSEISRNKFNDEDVGKLTDSFMSSFGGIILYIFKNFSPFQNYASVTLEAYTANATTNAKIKSILFDGQGVQGVFERHRSELKSKFRKGIYFHNEAEISSIIATLDAQKNDLDRVVSDIYKKRADKIFDGMSNKSQLLSGSVELPVKLRGFIDNLFSDVLTSVAFQTALVATFIGLFEKTHGLNFWKDESLDVKSELENYVSQIDNFFWPRSLSDFKKLVAVFKGEIKFSDGVNAEKSIQIIETENIFKSVVMTEEMKPDLWPKYKYILLELWQPKDIDLSNTKNEDLNFCRSVVMQDREKAVREKFLKEKALLDEKLSDDQRLEIKNSAIRSYKIFLKNLTHSSHAEKLTDNYFKSLFEPVDEPYPYDYTLNIDSDETPL